MLENQIKVKNNKLTGIERELVLQYLIDGNVPVTLTPLEDSNIDDDFIHSVTSEIFPVAIKGDNVLAKNDGTIVLQNPSQSVVNFANKLVKVEFYFNRVGLYFNSIVKQSGNDLIISIPDSIDRVVDVIEEKQYDFSALIYFECRTGKELNLKCIPWHSVELFTRPVWKYIPLENQKQAKLLLEDFVEMAKKEKNIGNGLQLIPICNFLTYSDTPKIEAMQDREKDINILYIDHERIVIGLDYTSYTFMQNDEYGIKMIFTLKNCPINSRDVFVTTVVNKIYKNQNERKFCIDLKIINIQEEDLRYVYEKATKTIFI